MLLMQLFKEEEEEKEREREMTMMKRRREGGAERAYRYRGYVQEKLARL